MDSSAEAIKAAEAFVDRPFDITVAPPYRMAIIRPSSGDAPPLFAFAIHHIAADFQSLQVLMGELSTLYSVAPSIPPDLEDVADVVAHHAAEEAYVSSPEGLAAQVHWLAELANPSLPFRLPSSLGSSRRESEPTGLTGSTGHHRHVLAPALVTRLRDFARTARVTPAMVVLTAFQVLLFRNGDHRDPVIAVPGACRRPRETRALVGLLANPMAIRWAADGATPFRSALEDVRGRLFRGLEHERYPFPRIVEMLDPPRAGTAMPLTQVMYVWQQMTQSGADAATSGLFGPALPSSRQRGSAYDLMLAMTPREEELASTFTYDTRHFDAQAIERLARQLDSLLDAAIDAPETPIGRLPLLSVEDQTDLLRQWTGPTVDLDQEGPTTIDRRFLERVKERPDALALVSGDVRLTYAALGEAVAPMATRLRAEGVGPGHVVGLHVERRADMVVAMLAILSTGAAYLPLDPTYPDDRLRAMVDDTHPQWIVTWGQASLTFAASDIAVIDLASPPAEDPQSPGTPVDGATGAHSAYLIYTSGSTGKPKGIVVSHRNVLNLFSGLERSIGAEVPRGATWLSTTSIAFDISVLELLWTLCRGDMVVLGGAAASPATPAARPNAAKNDFSLFFFPRATTREGIYTTLLESGRFADQHGFKAVWLPERHFHAFGGDYPNPAVAAAALAAITERIGLRAGSVVAPLHDPIRVAEEWAMVDHLSNGRVGLSFAAGWHEDDFVLAPDQFADRKALLTQDIDTIQRLWRGESIARVNGAGRTIEVSIRPVPKDPRLDTWLTAAGNPETFRAAGAGGFNLLTHMLGQNQREIASRIALYRQARLENGHDRGHVTIMLHTLVGDRADRVKALSEEPFKDYLRSSIDLMRGLARASGIDPDQHTEQLIAQAYHRFSTTSALFGTPEELLPLVRSLRDAGCDEVACLIDFGVGTADTLANLPHLARLASMAADRPDTPVDVISATPERSPEELILAHGVTHLQCTPALLHALLASPKGREALSRLRVLLVGGEPFPPGMAARLAQVTSARLFNMYGPTETTVWSAVRPVEPGPEEGYIGGPLANTTLCLLDEHGQMVPPGVPGELCIGGAGVALGYHGRPDLTEAAFGPASLTPLSKERLYRTGDFARIRGRGLLEFLGRKDQQVKVRGVRIELGEVEGTLSDCTGVAQAIAVVQTDDQGVATLGAYLVAEPGVTLDLDAIRARARSLLPAAMMPSRLFVEDRLPMTLNGKVDRKALTNRSTANAPSPPPTVGTTTGAPAPPGIAANTDTEDTLAAIWRDLLDLPTVGIHDNFFEIGGHSILATKLVEEVNRASLGSITLPDIFTHTTISDLARHLSAQTNGQSRPDRVLERAKRQRAALGRSRRTPARDTL